MPVAVFFGRYAASQSVKALFGVAGTFLFLPLPFLLSALSLGRIPCEGIVPQFRQEKCQTGGGRISYGPLQERGKAFSF